jgi:hypothetical protein
MAGATELPDIGEIVAEMLRGVPRGHQPTLLAQRERRPKTTPRYGLSLPAQPWHPIRRRQRRRAAGDLGAPFDSIWVEHRPDKDPVDGTVLLGTPAPPPVEA